MADYLTPKLPNRVIPLTKDCDRAVVVRRKNGDGDPVDWDADIYMLIDIVRGDPERINAVVVDDVATIKVESEVTNLCRSGTTWRVVMSESAASEVALMVGTFERNDGK